MKKSDLLDIIDQEIEDVVGIPSLKKEFTRRSRSRKTPRFAQPKRIDISPYINEMLKNIDISIRVRLAWLYENHFCKYMDNPTERKEKYAEAGETEFKTFIPFEEHTISGKKRPGLHLLSAETWNDLKSLAKKKGKEEELNKQLTVLVREIVNKITPSGSFFGFVSSYEDYSLVTNSEEHGLYATFVIKEMDACKYFLAYTDKNYYYNLVQSNTKVYNSF